MEPIIYRPIQKKDYPEVAELLNQSFQLYKYISDPKRNNFFKLQYVYSCLSEATYTCVAEQHGRVIGVIMGNANSDYQITSHLWYLGKTFWYSFRILTRNKKHKSGVRDYQKLHKIYRAFLQKHKGEFDGVLTLFAVNEKYRGYGIGKKLLDGLLTYLNSKYVTRIYLYTDTTCSYEFYEHKGFERLEEKSLTITREGKAFQMDVFFYGYSL